MFNNRSGIWDRSQIILYKSVLLLCIALNFLFVVSEVGSIISIKFARFSGSDYYVPFSEWAFMLGIFIPVSLYILYKYTLSSYSSWCLECYLYRGVAKICPHCSHKRWFGVELFD